jgi:hypothetical protein
MSAAQPFALADNGAGRGLCLGVEREAAQSQRPAIILVLVQDALFGGATLWEGLFKVKW